MLENVFKKVVKTGKYVTGLKEVVQSLKGSKIVIYSKTLCEKDVTRLVEGCRILSIPVLPYDGSTVELGKICGKPFRISTIAVKSPGEADLSPILEKTMNPL
jgi:large subunit ribosomal protein L30e